MGKIYDVFPFYNELDLLEIRFNHLYDVVDYFVITEADVTHAGNAKPLFFKENAERFQKFLPKVIHNVATDFPADLNNFARDWYQRDSVYPVLASRLADNDILIYGDVDEIPNLKALQDGIAAIRAGGKMAHLAQDVYYYYLNLEEVSGSLLSNAGEFSGIASHKWLGTNITSWGFSKDIQPSQLRNPELKTHSVRIAEGGSHFSYVGGPAPASVEERVKAKLSESAHQELNTWRTLPFLNGRIKRGKDIFGRRGTRFEKRVDLTYLPEYVLANLDSFESLILK